MRLVNYKMVKVEQRILAAKQKAMDAIAAADVLYLPSHYGT